MNITAVLGRVLVVEDEPVLAGTVVNYLDRAGFDERAVHTGPDALTVARAWSPDVVVLDLGLPTATGSRSADVFGPSRPATSSC